MTDKELRKLSRAELLEMLVEQGRQMEQLKGRVAELEHALAERSIKIEKVGSIAEASLALNGVFEAAQAAADQYLDNLKDIYVSAKATYERITGQEEADGSGEMEGDGEAAAEAAADEAGVNEAAEVAVSEAGVKEAAEATGEAGTQPAGAEGAEAEAIAEENAEKKEQEQYAQ